MSRQARPTGRAGRRLRTGAALAVLACAVTVAAAPGVAAADGHEHVTISGIDLAELLTVTDADSPERYARLRTEVAWLVGRDGNADEPDPDTLGPQYTMTWQASERAHRFQLYPLADGGPRVFRPADQPGDRSVDEAWFFARLSMSETLRLVGVPLTGDPAAAGSGGGRLTPSETAPPTSDALGFLDEWREGMLLTAALAVAVLAGVASIAFLLRRER